MFVHWQMTLQRASHMHVLHASAKIQCSCEVRVISITNWSRHCPTGVTEEAHGHVPSHQRLKHAYLPLQSSSYLPLSPTHRNPPRNPIF